MKKYKVQYNLESMVGEVIEVVKLWGSFSDKEAKLIINKRRKDRHQMHQFIRNVEMIEV